MESSRNTYLAYSVSLQPSWGTSDFNVHYVTPPTLCQI
eukprot:gene37956-51258_t